MCKLSAPLLSIDPISPADFTRKPSRLRGCVNPKAFRWTHLVLDWIRLLLATTLRFRWKRIRIPGHKLLSNRMVKCVTNVEAFTLRSADLEEVTSLFSRFLRNPRVQGALRYESRIQIAWRYRKKRLSRAQQLVLSLTNKPGE